MYSLFKNTRPLHQTFSRSYSTTPQSLIQKILKNYSPNKGDVNPGDFISIQPKHILTHDNTAAVMLKFNEIADKIANPRQPVFALDHNVQDTSDANLKKYEKISNFAKKHGIDFYPAGRGIGHQVMCEEGYAWPLSLVVASDSHSNMYGGLGCLGTPVVRTDAASIWATGQTWWQVPQIAKVELEGKLRKGVTGKDVIITLCGLFNKDEVLNHAIEFTGSGIQSLSIEDRLTIANMTTEYVILEINEIRWGALAGVFPIDDLLFDWLEKRKNYLKNKYGKEHSRINSENINQLKRSYFEADKNANYNKILKLDLSTVRPHVSGPNHVKVMTPLDEIEKKKIKIHKAYIVSCVNSRLPDLAQAAEILKGKKVHPNVELYVSAASSEVEAESKSRGDWQVLLDAGAKVLPPGCGPCIGLGAGLLKDGEVGISATNRNFKGRMGSKNAEAYLASPAVVAASAINGYISSPYTFESTDIIYSIYSNTSTASQNGKVNLIDGFPSKIEGEFVFCHQDNLNTDGIYPGKYTYDESITPSEQAKVAMENYDLNFSKIVQKGNILVGGFNFGTGSSREQAATALKYKGIPILLAGSFSETYKRNAINNGFLVMEVPDLVKDFKERFGTEELTKKTGLIGIIDFENCKISIGGKEYKMGSVGQIAQEIVLAGNLENWVKNKLK